jgi:hypothetical protein
MKGEIMVRKLILFLVLALVLSQAAAADDDIYYARCNLKVNKGDLITWVNWQAAPEILPIGTEVRITLHGEKATVVGVDSTRSYTLDMGASGDQFLEKFFIKTPIDLSQLPQNVQDNIRASVTRVGMSKEEAYMAMGPPAWVLRGNTNVLTYGDIMNANSWVYRRKRFGKNIGLKFDQTSGKVIDTEGIWK